MTRTDPTSLDRAVTGAHPAALLALAIGIAIGTCFAGAPARSAERSDGAIAPMTVASDAAAPVSIAGQTVEHRYGGDAQYRRCLDAHDGTNIALERCGGDLIEREDTRLNATWNRIHAPGVEATGRDLQAEQRAWIAFKDRSCLFYRSGRFGRDGQVLSYPLCRAGIIAERTATLEAYDEDTTP